MPRIIKINKIEGLNITVVFNNGESRSIDFKALLKSLNLSESSPAKTLLNPEEFSKVELKDGTLSWNNVHQYITMKDKTQMKLPFEIGADVLLAHSKPEKIEISERIGIIVKEQRLKSGLTQQELAVLSGTSRTYISRIENDKSDIELGTLRKIVETGLGKRLKIQVI